VQNRYKTSCWWLVVTYLCSFFWLTQPQGAHAQGCGSIRIEIDTVNNCYPKIFQFIVNGAPAGTACQWNTGTGSLNQLGDTVTGIYSTPGSYTIRLTATLPDGTICAPITENLVLVPDPRATFSLSNPADTLLCSLGRTVTLVNNTPGITSYEWFIDNQRFVTPTGSFSRQFNTPGCYTVILRIRDTSGCEYTETRPNFICVFDSIGIQLAVTQSQGCVPFDATFQATLSSGGNTVESINWQFPGGTPATFTGATPPPIWYTTAQAQYLATVNVRAASGCTYTRTVSFTSFPAPPKPTIGSGQLTACINSGVITLNNTTPGLAGLPGTFSWEFPGTLLPITRSRNTLAVRTSTPGTYSVVLVYTNGTCRSVSDTLRISFRGTKASFQPATGQQLTACQAPHTVTFNISNSSIGPGNIYTWLIPNANGDVSPIPPITTTNTSQTFTFADTGQYTVSLIVQDQNGCRDTLTRNNYVVIGSPEAAFILSDSSVCVGDPVVLTSMTEPVFFAYQRAWEISGPPGFNAVRFTSGRSATRTFTIPGTYTIKHIVSNAGQCSDSVTAVNILTVLGVAATPTASVFEGCPVLVSNLNAGVTRNIPNSPITYNWGAVGPHPVVFTPSNVVANPAVRFPTSGSYTIYLIVSNGSGCSDSVVVAQTFRVGLGGVIDLAATACNNTVLAGTAQAGIIQPTGYLWSSQPTANFLTPRNQQNVSVSFPTGGTYVITCILRSGPPTNCNDTIRDTIRIREIQGDFIANQTILQCATPDQPELVTFTSTINDGIAGYQWDFGDGTGATSGLPSVPHLYDSNGSFTVRLIITDTLGCIDTITKPNYINIAGPQPRFALAPLAGCDSVNVLFTDQTIGADTVYLDFDDGRGLSINPFDANSQVSRTYIFPFTALPDDSAYTFRPKLFAVDNLGCFTVFTDSITVWQKTSGSFSVDTDRGCMPLAVAFHSTGIRFDTLLEWDFDTNGSIDATGQSPAHIYTTPGTYVVTLRASNGGGPTCATLFTDTIVVYPLPTPIIGPADTTVCAGQPAVFSYITPSPTPITSRRWTLPDGTVSTDSTVLVTLTNPGTYPLRLVLTDANGCVDSLVLPTALTVSLPVGNIVSDPPVGSTLVGNTNRLNLQNTAQGAVTSIWLVDGQEVARGSSVSLDFREENPNLFVTLISLNADGCPDTLQTGPYVILLPQLNVPNVFTPNGDGIHDQWIIQYRGNSRLSVKVYDRWGVEMFSVADHLQAAWDGTTGSGSAAPDGVYFYILDDGEFPRSGQVTLLR